MSFGMNVFNSNGSMGYTTDDVTWNQVDWFQVWPGGRWEKHYPMNWGRSVRAIQMFINPPPTNRKAVAWTLWFSENNSRLTVLEGSEHAFIMVLMR